MRYGLLTPNAESTRASDLTERDGEECCSPDFLGVAAVRGRTWPGHSSVSLSRALGHGEVTRPSEIFTAQVRSSHLGLFPAEIKGKKHLLCMAYSSSSQLHQAVPRYDVGIKLLLQWDADSLLLMTGLFTAVLTFDKSTSGASLAAGKLYGGHHVQPGIAEGRRRAATAAAASRDRSLCGCSSAILAPQSTTKNSSQQKPGTSHLFLSCRKSSGPNPALNFSLNWKHMSASQLAEVCAASPNMEKRACKHKPSLPPA